MKTVKTVIQSINCYLSKERYPDSDKTGEEYIILGLNWSNFFICLEYFGLFYKNDLNCKDDETETLCELIGIFDKSEYECKENFIKRLNNELRTFSFMNYHLQITFYDIEENDRELFHSESCKTFRDKVLFETKLNILQMLQINLNEYQTEIYIFVLPIDKQDTFQNAIFTSNFFNTSATNSFYIKILEVSGIHADLSFLGYIQSDNHMFLKKCIECVADIVKKHIEISTIELFKDNYNVDHYSYKNEVIDLTKTSLIDAELQEKDEEIFCAIATNDDEIDSKVQDDIVLDYHLEMSLVYSQNTEYPEEYIDYKVKDRSSEKLKQNTIRQMEDRENTMMKNNTGADCFDKSFHSLKNIQSTFEQPKLNRGCHETIEIPIENVRRKEITFSKTSSKHNSPKLPKSKLFSPEELRKSFFPSKDNNTRLLKKASTKEKNSQNEPIHRFQEITRESIKGYKIPKYRDSNTPSSIRSFMQKEDEDIDVIDLDEDDASLENKTETFGSENKRKIFKNRENSTKISSFDIFGNTRKRR
ncbi:hypothetical protein PVAND_000718 [Polypedilum vanderplanki]|uniref:Uncharacterized protein n=1 Tax=Polypedilum vanderplanki TaxID=319348 RepID=A0A9J6BM45_POLVA|nr:hypothetical protein PVAND_000718 [Polypedilum vanderplanki]